jgi:hypothetical protein
MPMVVTFDHLLHGFDFAGCIQFAACIGPTPTVVSRSRETCDSECRIQRQNSPCTLDCSQQNSLRVAFGKSLIAEPDLRYPKHGDQQANHRTEQSRSMLVLVDLSKQVGAIAGSEIASNHIEHATVNPTSNG